MPLWEERASGLDSKAARVDVVIEAWPVVGHLEVAAVAAGGAIRVHVGGVVGVPARACESVTSAGWDHGQIISPSRMKKSNNKQLHKPKGAVAWAEETDDGIVQ